MYVSGLPLLTGRFKARAKYYQLLSGENIMSYINIMGSVKHLTLAEIPLLILLVSE